MLLELPALARLELAGDQPCARLAAAPGPALIHVAARPHRDLAARRRGSPSPRLGDTALCLAADFLIEPDGRVRAAKYGRHASDDWSVDELLQLASR